MEELKRGWEDFYKKAAGRIEQLEKPLSELDLRKSSGSTVGALMGYFGAVVDIVSPLIGLPYTGSWHWFGQSMLRVDKSGRIGKIKLYLKTSDDTPWWLVCEGGKGGVKYYVTKQFSFKKMGVDKHVRKVVEESYLYSHINEEVSNLGDDLKNLVEYLPKPFMERISSLPGQLECGVEGERDFFSFSEKLSEVEKAVRGKVVELEKLGFCDDSVSFSVGELLSLGFVPRVEPKKLERPVLALFRKMDQRVPEVMEELRRESPESFHSLLRVLEAEAGASFSRLGLLKPGEAKGKLVYFRNCGLPVEEYKRSLKLSLKGEESERRKRLNVFLEELDEI